MPVALLSVYQKEGIVEFARALITLEWTLLASGGTARALTQAGVPVRDVAELVGGKAILGHRVVTLSREVHAGLLSRNLPEDIDELERSGIPRVDLVCVDLYPLKEEIARPESTGNSVIGQTDIGGPTMLSSGAKGQRIVICDPADRQPVIEWLTAGKPDEQQFVTMLAAKADAVVADYRLTSARYHSGGIFDGMVGRRVQRLRYGENAYQRPSGLYTVDGGDPLAIDRFDILAGEAGYNNFRDLHRLLQTVTHIAAAFDLNKGRCPLIAVGCKHGNACGAAVGDDGADVLMRLRQGDQQALFGGFVMTNFPLDDSWSRQLLYGGGSKRLLLDGIVAPSFTEDARGNFERKGDRCKILANPHLALLSHRTLDTAPLLVPLRGGFLVQPNYTFVLDLSDSRLEKNGDLKPRQQDDLLLAWAIGATSNSNTITLVKHGMLIGNGVGQQDRVKACKVALMRARSSGHDPHDAIAYSDSFFPFDDGPKTLAGGGITAIFASSGSKRDDEVRAACREGGVTLWLIPDTVGRGFFAH